MVKRRGGLANARPTGGPDPTAADRLRQVTRHAPRIAAQLRFTSSGWTYRARMRSSTVYPPLLDAVSADRPQQAARALFAR